MDFETLSAWWRGLTAVQCLELYLGVAGVFAFASFVSRLRRGKGFWNALFWGICLGATLFLPPFNLVGGIVRSLMMGARDQEDREDALKARANRRPGSLTDEF
ncbi:hypothetical protein [Asticcacaulis solisilvae]|uniref:hypothetical protein n=1 Tax=Asticcacaulis solisilvae TaxID=1217274 RepID=UPI003FD7CDCA